jgi:predicted dehydrogenase
LKREDFSGATKIDSCGGRRDLDGWEIMSLTHRRRFLQSTAALAAGAWVAPQFAIGQPGPAANRRINLAFIGAGGRGLINLGGFPEENVVALCDVDDDNAAEAFNAHPKAKRFRDFRKMFDTMAEEIDAVVISTPDHTHFAATMAAMQLGKHVFCEKPLAHTVEEVRLMKQAAREHKVITQMGNQGHATEGIRLVKEWVAAGALGRVTEVAAWLGAINFESRFFRKPAAMPPPAEPVPAHLDWDLWLGPHAGGTPYNPIYHPRTWRGFYAFGSGLLGDWWCHTLDAPFWALGLGMPTVVECEEKSGGSEHFVPETAVTRFEFAARGDQPPVVLRVHEGGAGPKLRPEWGLESLPGSGMIMTGDKASLMTGERPNSARLLPEATWQAFRRNPPEKSLPRIRGGHFQEWADAIRGDGPMPGSNFDYAADLTEVALVGVISQRFGGRIEYDAANMKITNRPELDTHLRIHAREGWSYGKTD